MPEEIIKEEPKFDPAAFKNEILESVKETNKGIIDAVLAARPAEKKEEPMMSKPENINSDFNTEEFQAEMDAMGIDENQAKGMINLMGKIMAKKAPDFQKAILTEVNDNADIKDKKIMHTQNIRMAYPDADDKNSTLFKTAKIIYNQEMSDQAKSGPDAEAIAVERAAARLGIKPVTMADLKSKDAITKSGEGGGSGNETGEVSKSIADFFNVDHVAVNKKYKEILSAPKH